MANVKNDFRQFKTNTKLIYDSLKNENTPKDLKEQYLSRIEVD